MIILTEKQKAVYNYYKEHSHDTQEEIANAVGVSLPVVAKTFRKCNIKRQRENKKSRRYNPGDVVGENGCKLLKRTSITKNKKWKGEFECPICGGSFEAIISDVASGRCLSCGCSKEYQVGDYLGINKNKLIRRIKRRESLSHSWICEFECGLCGEYFITDISRVVRNDTMSCGCSSMSKGETCIDNILTRNNISFTREYSFEDCFNPKTHARLRFDFYLPDYNTCIEYDGEQHYKEVPFCPDALEDRQYRDGIKNEYCKNNHIHLIRIPYTDLNKIDDKYLLDKINLVTS